MYEPLSTLVRSTSVNRPLPRGASHFPDGQQVSYPCCLPSCYKIEKVTHVYFFEKIIYSIWSFELLVLYLRSDRITRAGSNAAHVILH